MKRLLVVGASLGLLSVVMGALGDHAFDLGPSQAESFETAVRYNMLYAVLLVALSLAPKDWRLALPAGLFAVGTMLFCFGIYLGTTTGIRAFLYATPVGGLTLMAGWVMLIVQGLKTPRDKTP